MTPLRVVARLKPLPADAETSLAVDGTSLQLVTSISSSVALVRSPNLGARYPFRFDAVSSPHASNEDFYTQMGARELVHEVLQGCNGSIVCFGQQGSGKSHTVFGDKGAAVRDA